jgi:predicted TIM-barrel fold metal-dependent hydrolase
MEIADRWHRDAQEKGVEKVVFVSGGGNDNLAAVVARHPETFIGFAHHHPGIPNAADELERAVSVLGLRGYKLLGPAIDTPINDKSFYPLWEVARAYTIPVLIHFGVLGAAGGVVRHVNIDPLILQNVAHDFPEVPFVLPHFGAGYPTQLLHLCWSAPNVYVDSSGSNQWVRWMMPEITLQDLMYKFAQTIGTKRMLFATDSSGFPRGFATPYLEEQHRIARFLGWSEQQLREFFSGTAERLLGAEA